jgi:hypothetical protein
MTEFNTGFVTALALFYAHSMDRELMNGAKGIDTASLSLYGASDHLFDMEIPESLDENLKSRIEGFRDYVFSVRLERIPSKEVISIFEDCRKLIQEIDAKVFGLEVVVNHP